MPLYKQDPNDTSKQIPDIRGENRYDRAVNPTHCKLIKTPNYVLVNTVLTLPVGFFFGSSGSFSELGAAGKSTKANCKSATSHYISNSFSASCSCI